MTKEIEENYEITFAEFELKDEILKAVRELGYEAPSPIQQKTIPLLLEGKDIIGQAQTGTGKTAAFALPVLQSIEVKSAEVQALVLTPTRELAIQVAEAIHSYAKYLGKVRVLPVYGGQSISQQIRHLRSGVQIIVGTPGRVMDHMRRETLDISNLKMVVLDEADEMLRMGFIEDVEWILSHTPKERQTALFSATMPREVRRIADNYLTDAENVKIEQKTLTVPTISQFYLNVSERQKTDALTRLLEIESAPGEAVLVFHRTKVGAAELADKLQARGYAAEPMHGDMSQSQRETVIKRLKNGKIEIVVATDVAARGLDVERISTVVNYDMPSDTESYVHRIGRTGRAGREGRTILFVTPRQQRMMRDIERYTKQPIEPIKLPSQADVAARRVEMLKEKIVATLSEQDLELYLSLVEDLAEETGSDIAEIAAAAVFLTVGDKPIEVNVEPEPVSFNYSEEGMVRLFIDLGRRHHISPGDIVGSIANEADIPGKAIGAIDVNDRFTLVDIPGELVDQVLKKMQRSKIRKYNMNIRLASSKEKEEPREKPRERDGERDGGRDGGRGKREFSRENDPRRAPAYTKRSDFKGKKTKRKESKKPFPKRKKGRG
jgi:ATP-dependent RNA helicase DeaD